ncbi:MAG: hypothetical protein IJB34_06780 [Clostridia bacterium]|nr:hypothetical protein [Clostridia bacterium]
MKNVLKKSSVVLMTLITLFSLMIFTACGESEKKEDDSLGKITTFYETVVDSQKCMDTVADDIYSCWYDAIYKDEYYGSIDLAIAYAQDHNKENLAKIEENEPIIQSLYKEVRDTNLSVEIKAVMSAYSDYYEFVVNVSGSFNSYSASKESLKKELASALKDLALEI